MNAMPLCWAYYRGADGVLVRKERKGGSSRPGEDLTRVSFLGDRPGEDLTWVSFLGDRPGEELTRVSFLVDRRCVTAAWMRRRLRRHWQP